MNQSLSSTLILLTINLRLPCYSEIIRRYYGIIIICYFLLIKSNKLLRLLILTVTLRLLNVTEIIYVTMRLLTVTLRLFSVTQIIFCYSEIIWSGSFIKQNIKKNIKIFQVSSAALIS